MNAFQIVTMLFAIVIAGEAAALAVSTHLVKKSQSPWISLKNDLLLALDVVVGLVLIMIACLGTQFAQPVWLPIFVSIGLLTHLFRIWEYLAKHTNAFCISQALWIVNDFKFSGLLLVLVWNWLA